MSPILGGVAALLAIRALRALGRRCDAAVARVIYAVVKDS